MSVDHSMHKPGLIHKSLRIFQRTFILLAMLLMGFPIQSVHAAATWTVTKAADTDDGVCDRDCSLREAMYAAGSGDTISFARTLTVTLSSPLPTIRTKITIKGKGSTGSIIQASECNPVILLGRCTPATYRVFEVESSGNLTLDGVTVRHGNCVSLCSTGTGGGIYNAGTLSLKNSTIGYNRSPAAGGGIDNDSGRLTLTNTTISANSANLGGGISNSGTLSLKNSTITANTTTGYGGGISNTGSLTLSGSTFLANSADVDGGGIYNTATLTITSGTFYGNRADNFGGGIYSEFGEAKVTKSAISGNSAYNGGGGIYNLATLTVADSTFFSNRGNNLSNYGGAIYTKGTLTVTRSTFSGNSAYGGGGIHNDDMLDITESIFSDNTAYYIGGGISNSATMYLTNSTFFENSASNFGGGVWNGSTLYATDSVFFDNRAPNGAGLTDDGQAYLTNTVPDN